jgi:hypothetical protein
MMTFSELLNKINNACPFKIINVEWMGEQLIVQAESLSLVFATSWWRITKNGLFLFGCTDENVIRIKQLKDLTVQKVVQQSQFCKCDLTIILSNGYFLETFSTSILEPWSVTINGETFFSNPSEKLWIN